VRLDPRRAASSIETWPLSWIMPSSYKAAAMSLLGKKSLYALTRIRSTSWASSTPCSTFKIESGQFTLDMAE
jgi:hypothetical protein